MCGRTACALDRDTLCKRCRFRGTDPKQSISPKWSNNPNAPNYQPSYNQAPGSYSPVLFLKKDVGQEAVDAIIEPMLWGLIPSFVKETDAKRYATANARIESLMQKPTYSNSMRRGWRCVVVAQGFYEWKIVDGKKQPYFIYPDDPDKMLMMAGVYAHNGAKQLFSYTVITTDSKGPMSEIHHRMPVILSTDDEVFTWLNVGSIPAEKAYAFLVDVAKNLKSAPLRMHKVSPRMNSTKYNESDCIVPLDETKELKSVTKQEGNSALLMAHLKRTKPLDVEDGSELPYKKIEDHMENQSSTGNMKNEDEWKVAAKTEGP